MMRIDSYPRNFLRTCGSFIKTPRGLRRSRRRTSLIATLALGFISTGQAAIVDLGNITRDTNSGLDWLDVTETAGLSYNEVSSRLTPGGSLAGWRYASAAEFETLVGHFGYLPLLTDCNYGLTYCDQDMATNNPIIENMIRTLGDTYDKILDEQNNYLDVTGAGYTYGMLATTDPLMSAAQMVASILDDEIGLRRVGITTFDGLDSVKTYNGSLIPSASSLARGSFLVAPSPVPLPPTGILLISALMPLFARSLKRRGMTKPTC
jgi:hypothetical protein